MAGCNDPETIVAGPADPQAEALKKAAPVKAPPMIRASRTYRCKDNMLLFTEYYTDATLRVRTAKAGSVTTLVAQTDSGPFLAAGWSVSGSEPQIKVNAPGHPAQSCNT
jgi:hypothetical protein